MDEISKAIRDVQNERRTHIFKSFTNEEPVLDIVEKADSKKDNENILNK